jgi:hypothetical protein
MFRRSYETTNLHNPGDHNPYFMSFKMNELTFDNPHYRLQREINYHLPSTRRTGICVKSLITYFFAYLPIAEINMWTYDLDIRAC